MKRRISPSRADRNTFVHRFRQATVCPSARLYGINRIAAGGVPPATWAHALSTRTDRHGTT